MAWDFFARPEEREALLAALRRDGRVTDFENAALLPDGRTVDCASNLAIVTDEETGESRASWARIRDITEQKRAEAERRTLEQQMQQAQKLESLGLLAGGIAHDFNNLLTGILGSAELALLELEPDHAARPRVEAIRPIARRATELCRELLAYSGRARFDVVAGGPLGARAGHGRAAARLRSEEDAPRVRAGAGTCRRSWGTPRSSSRSC